MLHFACCCKSSFSFQKIIKIMFFKFTFFHRDLKGIIARIHFTKWFTAFLRKKCKIWRSNWAFSNLCKICIWPSFWPKGKEIRKKKKSKVKKASLILKWSHVCNSQSWCFCLHNCIADFLKHNVAVSFWKQRGCVTNSGW